MRLRWIFGIIGLALAVSTAGPSLGVAKEIEDACLRSDREAANRSMCRCLQRVADQVLTMPDQRKAAGFILDPDRAQATRMSDNNRDEKFWSRYRNFGDAAVAICG